jgi:hypothetical protein
MFSRKFSRKEGELDLGLKNFQDLYLFIFLVAAFSSVILISHFFIAPHWAKISSILSDEARGIFVIILAIISLVIGLIGYWLVFKVIDFLYYQKKLKGYYRQKEDYSLNRLITTAKEFKEQTFSSRTVDLKIVILLNGARFYYKFSK